MSAKKDLNSRFDALEEQLKNLSIPKRPVQSSDPRYSTINRDDEVDLRQLLRVAWRGKWVVIGITFIFAVTSVYYAKNLPDLYRAQALLAPSEESQGGGMSAMAGKFGGLASLAGVSLEGSDKAMVAIEVMKSRQFLNAFIEKYDLLVPLIAATNWNRKSGQLTIDPRAYDKVSKRWIRNVSLPKKAKPSPWEAYREFSKVLSVSQNKATGLVTISVEHYSPVLAKHWTAGLIVEINAYMRERDVAEATKSIQYLTEKLKTTPVADMRTVFSQMIEEQTKVMMLAEVRDEYVFSTIDPAVVPEEKTKPKRALICMLGVILGGVLGFLSVFIWHFIWHDEKMMNQKEI